MTREVLLRRDSLTRGARPAAMPAFDAPVAETPREFRPGLHSFDLHGGVDAVTVGALAWFLATYAMAFIGGTTLPLALAGFGAFVPTYSGL